VNAHPNLSRFAQHADALVNNGWRPLPGYADTKRPSINGWSTYNERQWMPEELKTMIATRGQQEGQVICLAVQREIVAIDLDIEDEAQAKAIEQFFPILGATPLIRIGRAPRKLLIFRNDGSIKSRKLHPIEIFAGSGEIVGFGYHAKAGRDYQWPIKSPLELPTNSSEIPTISNAQLEAFLTQCWTVVERKTTIREEWVEPVFVGGDRSMDRIQALNVLNTAAEALALSPEGGRNNALFHVSYIAGQAIAAGLVQRHEAELIVMQAADACGLSTDDGHKGVTATLRSGITQGGNNPFFIAGDWFEQPDEPNSAGTKTTFDDDGFQLDDKKPFTFPPSLIKGLLPRNGIAFIGGQSGAGKTFVAIDLAVALTTQQPFFGKKIKEKVGVIIIAGEGAETIQPRITIARMARNIDDVLPIAWTDKFPDFTKAEEVKTFLNRLRRMKQRLRDSHNVRLGAIIIDTLAAVFNLEDENDNSEASKIIRAMKAIGDDLDALVMPIHHYGKGAETGLRGASAWRAGSDSVLSITADRNQLTGIVTDHSLWLAKSRVGEEGPVGGFGLRTMLLGVDEDGDELTSCYIVPASVKKATVAERRAHEEVALEALATGEWRKDVQSDAWAGRAIAESYGIDTGEKAGMASVKAMLKLWISEGKVEEYEVKDEARRMRKCIRTVKDKMSFEVLEGGLFD